jgi:hypothetical protein
MWSVDHAGWRGEGLTLSTDLRPYRRATGKYPLALTLQLWRGLLSYAGVSRISRLASAALDYRDNKPGHDKKICGSATMFCKGSARVARSCAPFADV